MHVFELYCNSARYNDADRLTAFVTSLSGDARDFIQSYPQLTTATYQELRAALESNFGARQKEAFEKLHKLTRTGGSLDGYIQEFRKLRNQSGTTHVRDDLQVTWFLEGLEPPALRNACKTNGPANLQATIDAAVRLESVYGYGDSGKRRDNNRS